MGDINYYLWLSIICMAFASFFTYKASEWSGRKVEEKLNQTLAVSTRNSADLGSLTGAGSFPLARIWDYSRDLKKTNINIQLLGLNSLKNIQVWGDLIENYSETEYPLDVRPFSLNALKPSPDLEIERLINGNNQTNIVTIPTLETEHCIMLFYQGDNDSWAQYIFRTEVNNRFETLNIIVDSERKVLFKEKTPNYPTTDDGYVYLNQYAKFNYDNLQGKRINFHPNNLSNQ